MTVPTREPAGQPVLTVRDGSVHFGGLVAVREVSLSLGEGEIVAIVGPNGAGKTTLLNAITGLVPMTGSVEVEGREVRAGDSRSVAVAGVARSFQSPQLVEEENAVENVLLGAHLRSGYAPWEQVFRRRKVADRERNLVDEAHDLLASADLAGPDLVRPVSQLTHGMRKRVDLARALMTRSRILLVDEPTSGMGDEEREIIERMMLESRSGLGTSILAVEHHMDVVRKVADRVVAMQTGSILRMGSTDDVLQSQEFIVAALGRVVTQSLELEERGPAPTEEKG